MILAYKRQMINIKSLQKITSKINSLDKFNTNMPKSVIHTYTENDCVY